MHGLLELVFVEPFGFLALFDPDVEQLVFEVEAELGALLRSLEVHVPAPEAAVLMEKEQHGEGLGSSRDTDLSGPEIDEAVLEAPVAKEVAPHREARLRCEPEHGLFRS